MAAGTAQARQRRTAVISARVEAGMDRVWHALRLVTPDQAHRLHQCVCLYPASSRRGVHASGSAVLPLATGAGGEASAAASPTAGAAPAAAVSPACGVCAAGAAATTSAGAQVRLASRSMPAGRPPRGMCWERRAATVCNSTGPDMRADCESDGRRARLHPPLRYQAHSAAAAAAAKYIALARSGESLPPLFVGSAAVSSRAAALAARQGRPMPQHDRPPHLCSSLFLYMVGQRKVLQRTAHCSDQDKSPRQCYRDCARAMLSGYMG